MGISFVKLLSDLAQAGIHGLRSTNYRSQAAWEGIAGKSFVYSQGRLYLSEYAPPNPHDPIGPSDEIRRLLEEGVSIEEVADRFEFQKSRILNWKRELGLIKRGRAKLKPPPPEIRAILGSKPDSHIAYEFKMPVSRIRKWRTQEGIKGVSPGRPTTHHPRLKESLEHNSFTNALVHALGTRSDQSLATLHKLPTTVVKTLRKDKGIPDYLSGDSKPWHIKLGKVPDPQLAAEVGLSRERIRQLRAKYGIPSFREAQHKILADEATPFLGKEPDEKIAERLGIPIRLVKNHRRELSIPSYSKRRLEAEKKLATIQDRIGKEPDTKLATEMGISTQMVRQNRMGRNLPSVKRSTVDRQQVAALIEKGKTDVEISNVFQCHPFVITSIRTKELHILRKSTTPHFYKWSKVDPLLGTASDGALARRFNRPVNTISKRRRKLKIPAFGHGKPPIPQEAIALMGTISDNQIAARFPGISLTRIRYDRIKRGIKIPKKRKTS